MTDQKRREMWISDPAGYEREIWSTDPAGNWRMHFEKEPIHVTELLPGDVLLSVDEVEKIRDAVETNVRLDWLERDELLTILEKRGGV